jgi:hypothetical protein
MPTISNIVESQNVISKVGETRNRNVNMTFKVTKANEKTAITIKN